MATAPSHTPPAPAPWQVHLALLAVQVMFGGFHVAAKAVLGHLQPLALAGLRVIAATPLLVGVAWATDRRLPRGRELLLLAGLGLLGVFGNQIAYITGLRHTTAVNASILVPSIPAFAAVVAALLRMERVAAGRWAGVGLSVAGAVVMLRPARFSLEGGAALGNALVLLNCLSYAAFLVLQRPVHRILPFRTIIAGAFVFGGAAVLAVSWPTLAAAPLGHLPPRTWAAVGYIVLFPTTLAYFLNTWAVGRSSAVLAAVYTTLQPLVSSLLAWLWLGEPFGLTELLGLTLIVAGLLQVSRRPAGPTTTAPRPPPPAAR